MPLKREPVAGRLVAAMVVWLLTGCATAPAPAPPATGASAPVAYLCEDGRQVEVQAQGADRLRLRLGAAPPIPLERAPSASGTRYLAASGLEFWSRGETALLVEAGRTQECRTAAAPSPGVERMEIGAPHPLTGTRWRVVALDGAAALPADPRAEGVPTLSFEDSASLTGSGGCNGYRAAWERPATAGQGAGAAALAIGQAASTRRACPPPLMQREQAFFALLRAVARYRLLDDGTLLLETPDGRALRARPAAG